MVLMRLMSASRYPNQPRRNGPRFRVGFVAGLLDSLIRGSLMESGIEERSLQKPRGAARKRNCCRGIVKAWFMCQISPFHERPMIDYSHYPAGLSGARWKAVRLGLLLANSHVGPALIAWCYALWALIGLLLCLVFIPMVIMGKADAFEKGFNPIALYGFVVPMAGLAAATWAVKLLSRLLWCAFPEPLVATFLALASVIGRLCVVIGAVHLWLRGGPWGKGLLLPQVVACSGIAWLGLVAEWGFIQTLWQEFIATANPARSSVETDQAGIDPTKDEHVPEQPRASILRLDLGEWFKSRFPRGYKLVVWILLPLGYVTVSSLADNGDPRAVLEAILRLAVIASVIVQTFWIPNDKLYRLIDAFSQTTPLK
jgi:hypothetical protein